MRRWLARVRDVTRTTTRGAALAAPAPARRIPIAVLPAAARLPELGEDWLYWPTPDAEYEAMIHAEGEYWRSGNPFNEMLAGQPRRQRMYFRFLNQALTGDPRTPWWRWLPRQAHLGRVATLGSNGGVVETALLRGGAREMDFYDLTAAGAGSGQVSRRFRARCAWKAVDLNFATLAEARYDLIVSDSCLHHVINLEHVLFEVCAALREGGLFAVFEYVGSARFQHSQAQRDLAEAVRKALPAWVRQPEVDCLGVPPLGEAWTFSPFEAIRSDAIAPLLHHYFEPLRWVELGGLWGLLGFTLHPRIYRERAMLEWLLRLDVELTRAKLVPPLFGFGLFRPK